MMWQASPRVRAALGLQAHLGVSPGLVLGLRVGDVDVVTGMVCVDIPGCRGPERVCYALPVDAISAVKPWYRKRKRHGASESPVTSIFAWGDFVPETRQVFGQKS